MATIVRTSSDNADFVQLVRLLDAQLTEINGESDAFYSQFNKIDSIKHVVVAYDGNKPVACGAIKEFEPGAMEVKRMYTLPECRGKGIASLVLDALETWAAEMGYNKCVLETGKDMTPANALYQKNGYYLIPNYGQYAGVDNSVCFEKLINVLPENLI